MTPVLGLLAAMALATGSILTKGVVDRLPARQLIGPLYLLNAVVVWPFAPFSAWAWSPTIIALHLVSVAVMAVTALAVFDLFSHGTASAVTTAQATSPLPAALAVALLVPATFAWIDVVAALVVVIGVLGALADSFGALGRRRAMVTGAVAATGGALVTVLSRLLADQGAGLVEIYSVRTTVAGLLFVVAVPPHGIPLSAIPALALRAVFVSLSFALTILGVQQGSPTVVQTMLALTPLFVIGWETIDTRRSPAPRLLAAAVLAALGVALVVSTG